MRFFNFLLVFGLLFSYETVGLAWQPREITAWEIRRNKMSDDRKQKIEQFLRNIAMIESSGGKNFDHAEIDQGMHKGHRAIGSYGLMPNTVKEVINRMRLEGNLNPDLEALQQMEAAQMKEAVEANPAHEKEMAEYLANRVLNRQGGDELKAAYSWERGHNLTPDKIEQRNYKDADYVKKFIELQNALQDKGGMTNE